MCSPPDPGSELRRYRIGDCLLELQGPPFSESWRLGAFRTERSGPPDLRLRIRAVEEVPAPPGIPLPDTGLRAYRDEAGRPAWICRKSLGEGLLYRAVRQDDTEIRVDFAQDCLSGLSAHLILRWYDLPRFCLRRNALFLHASYIAYGGKAILFTAPKQTGKSTQARLWAEHRGAEQINGDRALLRQEDGRWLACGSPYCGSSTICKNRTLPIAAIVSLHQAPFNRVSDASAKERLLAFVQGVTYDTADRQALETVIRLGEEISAAVPVLRLDCLPDGGAVECLLNALKEKNVYVD